jgi:hypothetical protein
MRHKQTLTRKNANFLSRSRRHKLRKFFVMTMSIGLFLIGCATIAGGGGAVVLDDKAAQNIKTALRGLEFEVLFAVDREGKVTAFTRRGKEITKFEFPIKDVKIIKEMTAITVFTLNPQTCWINSAGDQECVTW